MMLAMSDVNLRKTLALCGSFSKYLHPARISFFFCLTNIHWFVNTMFVFVKVYFPCTIYNIHN